MMADKVAALERALGELSSVAQEAGVSHDVATPEPPSRVRNPRSRLLNAAIYRRRLQIAVANLTDQVRDRLNRTPEVPNLPSTPYLDHDYAPMRLLGSIALVFVSSWLLNWQIFLFAYAGFLTAFGLVAVDFAAWENFIRGWIDYLPSRQKAKDQARLVRSQIAKFNTARTEVYAAMVNADEVLTSTLPPVVPRVFTGRPVVHTKDLTNH
jgi:hypothetical protein